MIRAALGTKTSAGRFAAPLIAVLGLLLLAAPAAFADPPGNDDFPGTTVGPTLPVAQAGNNIEATGQAGESLHGGDVSDIDSVWYSWTAPTTGTVTIKTCTANFDTVLGVYTGNSVGSLVPVLNGSNDDGCAANGCACGSKVSVSVNQGTQYRIAVDGYAGAQGSFTLRIGNVASPPSNDNFPGTSLQPGLPVNQPSTNVDATEQIGGGEGPHAGVAALRSVWYQWTPSVSRLVKVDVCDGNFNSFASGLRIAVYTGGAVGSLSEVASNQSGGYSCELNFSAVAATPYKIVVDANQEAAFTFKLRAVNAPGNDDFAGAQIVGPGLPVNVPGTNTNASAEPGESHAHQLATESVWYQWTPNVTRLVRIDVCSANFEVRLAVYTGNAIGSLTPVTNNAIGQDCVVEFTANATTTYKIAVDTFTGNDGAFTFNIHAANPPANDSFANAQVIGPGLPVTVSGSTIDATRESGETGHAGAAGARRSVWYSWTPSSSGQAKLEVCDSGISSFDLHLAVYTGAAVDSLNPLASNAAGDCRVTFAATAGQTYKIAVDADQSPVCGGPCLPRNSGEANFTLKLRTPSPPANDNFANATTIGPSIPISLPGTNLDATEQAGEPSVQGDPLKKSVWYSWSPTANVEARINVCDAGFFPRIGVFTGSLGSLSTVAESNGCQLSFQALMGQTYKIAIGAFPSADSEGTFTLDFIAVPANNDFANATVLGPGLPDTENGTLIGADNQGGEPSHSGQVPNQSVWYSWTPSSNIPTAKVDVCAAGFAPRIAVYTGNGVGLLTLVANNASTQDCTVSFSATAGTPYSIAVDGFNFAAGPFTLKLRTPTPPGNNDLGGATPIGPGPATVLNQTNADATAEGSEPNHASNQPARRSVWYSWNSGGGGPVRIKVCDAAFSGVSSFLPRIAVYTGSTYPLSLVADNKGSNVLGSPPPDCSVRFTAAPNTTYKIAVDSTYGEGAFTLQIVTPDPPPNDNFASAQAVVPDLPLSQAGDNIDSTVETGEPQHPPAGPPRKSVWFTWTPTAPVTATIDTCTSDFNTVLAVYTGSALNALTLRGKNNDGSCSGGGTNPNGSQVTLAATAGTTYRIAVDGFSGAEGSFTLKIASGAGPPPAPQLTATNPPSGSNENDPKLIGTAAGSTVTIHKFGSPGNPCGGPVAGTGTADQFASTGIPVHVANNSTTTFYATTTNAAGTSVCSSSGLTYAEVTATAPPAPTFTGTTPATGSNVNNPQIRGNAPDADVVTLYTGLNCTGNPVASGSAAQFGSPGFTVSVPDNSATTFYAIAANDIGNSPCSPVPLTYTETTPTSPPTVTPPTPTITPPAPPAVKKCKKTQKLKRGKCVKKKKK